MAGRLAARLIGSELAFAEQAGDIENNLDDRPLTPPQTSFCPHSAVLMTAYGGTLRLRYGWRAPTPVYQNRHCRRTTTGDAPASHWFWPHPIAGPIILPICSPLPGSIRALCGSPRTPMSMSFLWPLHVLAAPLLSARFLAPMSTSTERPMSSIRQCSR